MLQAALTVDESYILKLYQNNHTPAAADAAGSFTEATFTNYAAVTLTRAGWNAAVTVSGKAQCSYGSSPQAWTCGATGNTIYGYYVTGATSGMVLFSELYSASRILANGDVMQLTPTFTLNTDCGC